MTAFPVSFIYHGMKVPAAFPYLDILIHGKPDSDSACRKQPKCRAILFAPFDALRKKGVPQGSLDLIRYGDTRTVNGFTVRIYHGKHAVLPKVDAARIRSWVRSPARWNVPRMLLANRDYRESDETVFYLLEADGKTAALMGSMNLRDEVEYPTCADVLVLPYNGWTDNLSPAVRTVDRLKPKRILLDHYDNTFPPVSPPVDLSPVLQKYAGLATAMFYGKAERI